MANELLSIFERVVTQEFSFLPATGKFKGPYSELDQNTGIFMVRYFGRHLVVQLLLDRRDQDISCKIAKVVFGHETQDYSVDKEGNIVREHLSVLIKRSRNVTPQFTKVTGLTLAEQIPLTIKDYARMMKEYGQSIIEDDVNIFEPI